MEDLTKQQLVLLTLLLSFVTSIGTGIITVSLIDTTSNTVTQTINRVVEKTIETVTPETIKETETRTEIVVEKDDVIAEAIEKAMRSIVRVYSVDGDARKFVAMGVVVSPDGTVAVTVAGFVDGFKYLAEYSDGSEYEISKNTELIEGEHVVFLSPKLEEGDETEFTVIAIANTTNLKLGQSVINIGGEKNTSSQIGRIGTLVKETAQDETTYLSEILTDMSSATPGSLLINLSGSLVGYNSYVGDAKLQKSFIASSQLVAKVAEIPEEPPTNNNP